nr:class I SAM-dependent methyltransferase [Bacteriovorax sp. HI3]
MKIEADSTAIRTALWRAMHKLVDSPPLIIDDEIGLKLIAPPSDWRERPDMHPIGTRGYRASIVARARLIEDLVEEKYNKEGVDQYVMLGAGLDTFVQRRPELASKLNVFEIDKPSASGWKKERLLASEYGIPAYLHLVPVDFESNESWMKQLQNNGFDKQKPAVITSTGVTLYLTREAIMDMLKQVASFAPGSTFAMTFMLPAEMVPDDERPAYLMVQERARASGTPFLSFFHPDEMIAMAREAGLKKIQHISTEEMKTRFFNNRADGLMTATGEEFLIVTT